MNQDNNVINKVHKISNGRPNQNMLVQWPYQGIQIKTMKPLPLIGNIIRISFS